MAKANEKIFCPRPEGRGNSSEFNKFKLIPLEIEIYSGFSPSICGASPMQLLIAASLPG